MFQAQRLLENEKGGSSRGGEWEGVKSSAERKLVSDFINYALPKPTFLLKSDKRLKLMINEPDDSGSRYSNPPVQS